MQMKGLESGIKNEDKNIWNVDSERRVILNFILRTLIFEGINVIPIAQWRLFFSKLC